MIVNILTVESTNGQKIQCNTDQVIACVQHGVQRMLTCLCNVLGTSLCLDTSLSPLLQQAMLLCGFL